MAGRLRAARVHRRVYQAHRGDGWVISFGKSIDPAIVALLEARVRKGAMVLSADTNAQQAVQAVHDDLVMRGIARWTISRYSGAGWPSSMPSLAADRLGPLVRRWRPTRTMRLAAMRCDLSVCSTPNFGETVATAYF